MITININNSDAYVHLIKGATWLHTEADFRLAGDIVYFLDIEKRLGGDPLSWFTWKFYHSTGDYGAYDDIVPDFIEQIREEMGDATAREMDYVKALHVLALNMKYAVFFYDDPQGNRTICIPIPKHGKMKLNGIFKYGEKVSHYRPELHVARHKLFTRERKYLVAIPKKNDKINTDEPYKETAT